VLSKRTMDSCERRKEGERKKSKRAYEASGERDQGRNVRGEGPKTTGETESGRGNMFKPGKGDSPIDGWGQLTKKNRIRPSISTGKGNPDSGDN